MTKYEFLAVMKSLSVILECGENESPEAANAKAKKVLDYVIRQAEDENKND